MLLDRDRPLLARLNRPRSILLVTSSLLFCVGLGVVVRLPADEPPNDAKDRDERPSGRTELLDLPAVDATGGETNSFHDFTLVDVQSAGELEELTGLKTTSGWSDPLEDPLRAVALLFRHRPVRIQDRRDPIPERADFRLRARLAEFIARRQAVVEYLLQRRPVHPRLAEDLTPAHALDQHPLTDRSPLLHIAIHLLASDWL